MFVFSLFLELCFRNGILLVFEIFKQKYLILK